MVARFTTLFGRLVIASVAGALILAYLAVPATAQSPAGYAVRIENLTRGQPFTPPVLTLHGPDIHVFEVGSAANPAIRELAENGKIDPLADDLGDDHRIDLTRVGDAPIVAAGSPADGRFDPVGEYVLPAVDEAVRLSWVSMLICTNDGFTGLDGIALPTVAGQSVTVDAAGYETHSEVNTEDLGDIVMPCQDLTGITSDKAGSEVSDPELGEGGVVALHDGIRGDRDLDLGVHGWSDPVALVTITALDEEGVDPGPTNQPTPRPTDQPTSEPTIDPAEETTRTVGRVSGATRIATAVAISQRAFPDRAQTVYLARADNPVDAVVGGALTDGPILLVPTCDGLPPAVAAEIDRLDPDQVLALGGAAAVCDATLLAALG